MNVKKMLVIIISVITITTVFIGGFYARGYYDVRQQKDASNVAAKFIKDVATGKTDDAYNLTSKSLQSKQSKDDFAKTLADLKADNPSFDVPQSTQRDGNFYYSQRVLDLPKSVNGSTTGAFLVVLNKDDGSWKISSVTVN